jgi:hypothetical protein
VAISCHYRALARWCIHEHVSRMARFFDNSTPASSSFGIDSRVDGRSPCAPTGGPLCRVSIDLPPRKERLTAGAVTTKRCVAKNVIPPIGDATQVWSRSELPTGPSQPGWHGLGGLPTWKEKAAFWFKSHPHIPFSAPCSSGPWRSLAVFTSGSQRGVAHRRTDYCSCLSFHACTATGTSQQMASTPRPTAR